MSIQDIANYVRQTPGNTNPSVIASMVKSEVGEYVEEASNEALHKLGIKIDRKETWLLPEQSFVMEPIMDGAEEGMFGGTFTPVGKTLPEELCFIINGVVCKSKKQTMEHNADTIGWYGNAAFFSPDDFEETSEPFFMMLDLNDSSFQGGIINPDTGNLEHAGTTHTFGIYILEESTTPISKKYLPEGFGDGPVVIDLTQFMTESGPPFNNYVLTTLATSVGSGKVEKTTVVDKDGALRKALYTDRQVILTTTVEDNGDIFYIKYPVTVANNTSAQRVGDVSGYAILYMNGVALEMKCVIGFASNSDDVSISIKATPFFA